MAKHWKATDNNVRRADIAEPWLDAQDKHTQLDAATALTDAFANLMHAAARDGASLLEIARAVERATEHFEVERLGDE